MLLKPSILDGDDVSELNDLKMAFEKFGFEKLNGAVVVSNSDVWYRHQKSNNVAEVFAYLSYKPRAKAYNVDIGILNRAAHESVKQAFPQIQKIMDPDYFSIPFLMERPCWSMLDAGRALNWPSFYVIPNPKNRSGWPSMFQLLCDDFIAPLFLQVKTLEELFKLLCRSDPPFEWEGDQTLRMSEIIVLAKVIGINRRDLDGKLRLLLGSASMHDEDKKKSFQIIESLMEIFWK